MLDENELVFTTQSMQSNFCHFLHLALKFDLDPKHYHMVVARDTQSDDG